MWEALKNVQENVSNNGMLKAIVAFKGEVLDVKCKIKLNQHRSEAHERMKADYAQGTDQERALAHWMVRLGL